MVRAHRSIPDLSQKQIELIRRQISKPDGTDCWIWSGKTTRKYGSFSISGKQFLVHRIMYKLVCGIDPGAMHVCHHCDNPPCVNPAHFFLGTDKDNVDDMVRKGRNVGFVIAHGEHNLTARFTDKQIIEIRREYAAGGVTCKAIGDRFNVNFTTIHKIVKRYTWKHI